MRDEWMLDLLYRIAESAERRRKIAVDEELGTDIQEIVTARIRAKLHTIKNPNNAPWSKCIIKWCHVVAGNRCEDVRKKNGRFVFDRDVEMVSLVSTLPSPEEELERKEQVPLRKRLRSKIPAAASRARAAAAGDERQILSLWVEGNTLKQIEEQMGIQLSTVQRKLKKIQKVIVKGVGNMITEETGEAIPAASWLMKVLQEVVEDRGLLHQLLANRPREVRRRAPRPHA
jgi:DNA-binding CsgD family transcriptional regulator